MSLGTLVAGLLPASLVLASPAPANLGPAPSGIYNGEEVEHCEWPMVVAMRQGGALRCTSSLLSPRVVLTARHCLEALGGPNATNFEFVFGEDVDQPQKVITPQMCRSHPSNDLGFCVLSAPVTDVPFVPPLVGCEQEELWEGREVTILGYGSDFASMNDQGEWDETAGSGPKRKTFQYIETIVGGVLYLLGDDSGGCPGDSGGPAMVQLEDGSWRTLGSAWAIHPGTPEVMPGENVCGYGTLYTSVTANLEWIEEESGQDVTPCHDADGTWNPSPRCRNFPMSPGLGVGNWSSGCFNPDVSGWGESCGPAWQEPEPPDPEPPLPPDPEPPLPPDPEPPTPDPSSGTGGDETLGSETGFGDGPSGEFDGIQPHTGCNCDAGGDAPRFAWLALLPLLGMRRRRYSRLLT